MLYILICVLVAWSVFFPYSWAGLPSEEVQYTQGDYFFLSVSAAFGPIMLFLWVINL